MRLDERWHAQATVCVIPPARNRHVYWPAQRHCPLAVRDRTPLPDRQRSLDQALSSVPSSSHPIGDSYAAVPHPLLAGVHPADTRQSRSTPRALGPNWPKDPRASRPVIGSCKDCKERHGTVMRSKTVVSAWCSIPHDNAPALSVRARSLVRAWTCQLAGSYQVFTVHMVNTAT